METIFSIHQVLHYKNHVIRAEKRSLFYTMEYSLIIDDVKQDQIKGLYGILILHGMLNDNGHQKPVKVIIKQTIFTSKFYCKIDGEIHKMNKYKFDSVTEYINTLDDNRIPTALIFDFSERARYLYWLFWSCYNLDIDKNNFFQLFNKDLDFEFPWEMKVGKLLGTIENNGDGFKLTDKGAYLFHFHY